VAPARDAVWDCAAGSGQASLPLADRFIHVYATDASATQLAEAPVHERITWSVAPAEASGLDPHTVDAVTVAQALHWFDLRRFWTEVRRDFHDNVVGPYWPIERGKADAGYQGIDLPFARIEAPPIPMTANWTLDHLTGYLRTWSATRRYIVEQGKDPVTSFADTLRIAWGDGPREVRWPLTILAGRVEAR
jgi:hypothetical protein